MYSSSSIVYVVLQEASKPSLSFPHGTGLFSINTVPNYFNPLLELQKIIYCPSISFAYCRVQKIQRKNIIMKCKIVWKEYTLHVMTILSEYLLNFSVHQVTWWTEKLFDVENHGDFPHQTLIIMIIGWLVDFHIPWFSQGFQTVGWYIG